MARDFCDCSNLHDIFLSVEVPSFFINVFVVENKDDDDD